MEEEAKAYKNQKIVRKSGEMLSPGPDTGSHIVSSPQLWLSALGLYMTAISSSLL